MTSSFDNKLEVLRRLLAATQAGKVSWQPEGEDGYAGSGSNLHCHIQFAYPNINDGVAMDRDRVEVGVNSFVHRFYVGSEGYDLVIRILKVGLPAEWDQYNDPQFDPTIEVLRELDELGD